MGKDLAGEIARTHVIFSFVFAALGCSLVCFRTCSGYSVSLHLSAVGIFHVDTKHPWMCKSLSWRHGLWCSVQRARCLGNCDRTLCFFGPSCSQHAAIRIDVVHCTVSLAAHVVTTCCSRVFESFFVQDSVFHIFPQEMGSKQRTNSVQWQS